MGMVPSVQSAVGRLVILLVERQLCVKVVMVDLWGVEVGSGRSPQKGVLGKE